jgi:polyisoprenoid-binding protein YceI
MNQTLTNTGPVTVPPAGDYHIDPRRSTVSFTTRHLFGLATVRGRFALRDGHVHVDQDVRASSVHAVISAGSVATGNPSRDANVRSGQLLDTERHPDIAFVADRVVRLDGQWVLRGSLKVRGRACPVDVRVDSAHTEGATLVVNAGGQVDRYAFGVSAMKLLVARRLTISLVITAEPAHRDR